MSDYDSSKPESYIQYLDANNLYGWAMLQKLPMRDFGFLDDAELSIFDVDDIDVDNDTGYLIECTLDYPPDTHDQHKDLPLAPEKRRVYDHEFSPFARRLRHELNGDKSPMPKAEKLLTTLTGKHHYVLHIRNLKLYLSLGMRLKAVHKVLSFHQESWLSPYITFNTAKRAKAKTPFERDFYKTLNVSLLWQTHGGPAKTSRYYTDLLGEKNKKSWWQSRHFIREKCSMTLSSV